MTTTKKFIAIRDLIERLVTGNGSSLIGGRTGVSENINVEYFIENNTNEDTQVTTRQVTLRVTVQGVLVNKFKITTNSLTPESTLVIYKNDIEVSTTTCENEMNAIQETYETIIGDQTVIDAIEIETPVETPSMAAFAHIWDGIEEEIEFDESWNNGTGYFDDLVNIKCVTPGQRVKCETPTGRRMIIVGTVLGNVIVFERHAPGLVNRSKIIAVNAPRVFNCITGGSVLNEDKIYCLAGTGRNAHTIVCGFASALAI